MRALTSRATKGLLTLALATAVLAAWPGPVEPGQHLPVLRLKDQHEKEWYVHADTRLVIFAAGRRASNLVMAVLGPQPRGFLASRRAVYLADMSSMPGFVTRTFALPSLRDQNFEVGVVLDDKTLTGWPRQDDAVTLIRLDNGRVVQHEYVDSEARLRSALGL
jgi:hypothetical protein